MAAISYESDSKNGNAFAIRKNSRKREKNWEIFNSALEFSTSISSLVITKKIVNSPKNFVFRNPIFALFQKTGGITWLPVSYTTTTRLYLFWSGAIILLASLRLYSEYSFLYIVIAMLAPSRPLCAL